MRVHDLIAEQTILPGILEAIADAQQLGLRLGVASSSGREWVEGYLNRLRLRQHFEVVLTRDDVARVKTRPCPLSPGCRRARCATLRRGCHRRFAQWHVGGEGGGTQMRQLCLMRSRNNCAFPKPIYK